MRKLASIQRVTSISPILGADKIEKATILGWEVIIKKGEFKPQDFCVYCEIDSILPDKPEFEFLRPRKFRIKTIKMKGQVSQGICFPLDVLPKQYFDNGLRKKTGNEGDDVTELLGIVKYDPQAEAERKESDARAAIEKNRLRKFFMRYPWYRRLVFRPTKLPFPSWIKKTDEDRIQLFPNICNDSKGDLFFATEKLDGQSATYFIIKNDQKWQFWKPYLFGVCSRNFQWIKKDNNSYWDIYNTLRIKAKLISELKSRGADRVVFQGEIIGPKIQGNKYKKSKNEFYLFNLIINNNPLPWTFTSRRCRRALALNHVPCVFGFDRLFFLPDTIQDTIELSKGNSSIGPCLREGLVFRGTGMNGSLISFKVINPDFLLTYQES